MKEIEKDTKEWKNIPCSWIGRTSIVKMSILHKAIYTLKTIPIKIAPAFFLKLEQTILKLVCSSFEKNAGAILIGIALNV